MLQQKQSMQVRTEAAALRRSFSETTNSAEVSRLWSSRLGGRGRDPSSQMYPGQVWVKTRADLPTINPSAKVKMYYNEVKLMGSSILALLSQYHSGAKFVVHDGSHTSEIATELWADVGMFEALHPTSYGPEGPVFNNSGAVIIFSPNMDGEIGEYWNGAWSTKVAELTGSQLNAYFDAVLSEWLGGGHHNYYSFWSLAPHGHMTVQQKWHNIDNSCDSFSMWSLWKAAEVGAELMTDGPIIRRNYVEVTTDGKKPEIVDGSLPEVADFFKKFKMGLLRKHVKTSTFTELVSELVSFFTQSQTLYYIDQRAGINKFGKVTLAYPFINGLSYLPMPLPPQWHAKCSKNTQGTCQMFSCDPWRKATCSNSKCVCPPGACVFTDSFGITYCSNEV